MEQVLKEAAIDHKIEDAVLEYYSKQNPEIAEEIRRRKAPKPSGVSWWWIVVVSLLLVACVAVILATQKGKEEEAEKPPEAEVPPEEAAPEGEPAELHADFSRMMMDDAALQEGEVSLYEELSNLEDLLALEEEGDGYRKAN